MIMLIRKIAPKLGLYSMMLISRIARKQGPFFMKSRLQIVLIPCAATSRKLSPVWLVVLFCFFLIVPLLSAGHIARSDPLLVQLQSFEFFLMCIF